MLPRLPQDVSQLAAVRAQASPALLPAPAPRSRPPGGLVRRRGGRPGPDGRQAARQVVAGQARRAAPDLWQRRRCGQGRESEVGTQCVAGRHEGRAVGDVRDGAAADELGQAGPHVKAVQAQRLPPHRQAVAVATSSVAASGRRGRAARRGRRPLAAPGSAAAAAAAARPSRCRSVPTSPTDYLSGSSSAQPSIVLCGPAHLATAVSALAARALAPLLAPHLAQPPALAAARRPVVVPRPLAVGTQRAATTDLAAFRPPSLPRPEPAPQAATRRPGWWLPAPVDDDVDPALLALDPTLAPPPTSGLAQPASPCGASPPDPSAPVAATPIATPAAVPAKREKAPTPVEVDMAVDDDDSSDNCVFIDPSLFALEQSLARPPPAVAAPAVAHAPSAPLVDRSNARAARRPRHRRQHLCAPSTPARQLAPRLLAPRLPPPAGQTRHATPWRRTTRLSRPSSMPRSASSRHPRRPLGLRPPLSARSAKPVRALPLRQFASCGLSLTFIRPRSLAQDPPRRRSSSPRRRTSRTP